MTVMMAVRNISLLGKCSFFSRKPSEKAMAPRRPPYAMMNWSLVVSLTMRNLLIK